MKSLIFNMLFVFLSSSVIMACAPNSYSESPQAQSSPEYENPNDAPEVASIPASLKTGAGPVVAGRLASYSSTEVTAYITSGSNPVYYYLVVRGPASYRVYRGSSDQTGLIRVNLSQQAFQIGNYAISLWARARTNERYGLLDRQSMMITQATANTVTTTTSVNSSGGGFFGGFQSDPNACHPTGPKPSHIGPVNVNNTALLDKYYAACCAYAPCVGGIWCPDGTVRKLVW